MIRLTIILGAFIVLTGCSSNSLVSSFSSRKYTKGIFKDAIGEKPAVISKSAVNVGTDKHVLPAVVKPVSKELTAKVLPATSIDRIIKTKPEVLIKPIIAELRKSTVMAADTAKVVKTPQVKKTSTMGITLASCGGILILFALLSFFGVLMLDIIIAIFIGLLGIGLLIGGLLKTTSKIDNNSSDEYLKALEKVNTNDNNSNNIPDAKKTNYGSTGLLFVLIDVGIAILALLSVFIPAVADVALLFVYVYPEIWLLVFLALLVAGILFCIVALAKRSDRHPNSAVWGLILGGVLLFIFLAAIF